MRKQDHEGEAGKGHSLEDGSQLLRYAEELRQLREAERLEREELDATRAALRQAQAQQLLIITDLKQAYEAERQRRRELHDAYFSTIKLLAAVVEARDDYTGGHIERVRAYSQAIGQELGLQHEALRYLEIAAILHDIGKIGVPDAVLTKSGPLNPEEWFLLKQHATIGAGLLHNVPFLSPMADLVATHHERWDGTGYPRGLKGEAIPLGGRIIAVADAFDAMTTDRVYRQGRDHAAALEEVERSAGSQFDPTIAALFIRTWKPTTFQ